MKLPLQQGALVSLRIKMQNCGINASNACVKACAVTQQGPVTHRGASYWGKAPLRNPNIRGLQISNQHKQRMSIQSVLLLVAILSFQCSPTKRPMESSWAAKKRRSTMSRQSQCNHRQSQPNHRLNASLLLNSRAYDCLLLCADSL